MGTRTETAAWWDTFRKWEQEVGGHRRRVKSGPSWHCGPLGESPGASLHPRPFTAPWAVSPSCARPRGHVLSP